ncbi:hypothetical protein MTR67_012462 [Solanum verrucosum]|uniref:Uncharacterized protein n=1 Tax=Solanum verrucosum TaxID=315347 RepID=A0AAF0Q8M3_SOLVR|nr:hypothetical protein MTR67_012462 [Solanum verrucosum]
MEIYEHTGFTGGLNYYRALDLNWELTAPWTEAKIEVPVKFIVGNLDLTYNSARVKDYINRSGLKKCTFARRCGYLERDSTFSSTRKAR